jgi:hypothetical protein
MCIVSGQVGHVSLSEVLSLTRCVSRVGRPMSRSRSNKYHIHDMRSIKQAMQVLYQGSSRSIASTPSVPNLSVSRFVFCRCKYYFVGVSKRVKATCNRYPELTEEAFQFFFSILKELKNSE